MSKKEIMLSALMNSQIARMKKEGRLRTAETYQATLNSFSKYLDGRDICMNRLNGDTMQGYEAWLKHEGLTLNTIAFYIKRLRASYNKGLRKRLFANRHPFEDVFTGKVETHKRALPMRTLKRIMRYEAADERELLARDLFLFSFMTHGMSFVDIAMLRKRDLKDGYIIYIRKKTGQQLEIEMTKEIMEIVCRHPSQNDYLLPIITRQGGNERNQLRYVQMWVNKSLKHIGRKLSPSLHLTMYCARHSWATIARDMKIPMAVISRGLGHTSERTTRIYLKSIDTGIVSRANRGIIKALMR